MPHGPPPIFIGALGLRLTQATAEVADGLLVMPFGAKRFLHEVTMPAVRAGLAARGCGSGDFTVVPAIIVSIGEDAADHAATRRLLAFYGSTPAYRPVLDSHGWGEVQPELHALSKQGRWQEMGELIDEDMLHTIAACGSPAEVAAHIRDRVHGVADRSACTSRGRYPRRRWQRSSRRLIADALSWYRSGPRGGFRWQAPAPNTPMC